MSDTPNEIWCDTGLYYDYKTDWSEGSWRNNDNCGGVKYVRADRIEELQTQIEELHHAVTAAHFKGYMDGKQAAEAKLNDQTRLIEQFFALLDIKEQKDDGRYFYPNIIRSSRALDAEKLEEILVKLRGYING